MSRLLGLAQVPVFVEKGDAKVTTEFGKDIPDYPTKGKTGDHWGLDIVRCSDGSSSELANICAIADGIIYAQRKWVQGFNREYSAGNCVYIQHEDGTVTKYYHLAYGTMPDWIKDNAVVHKGDVLGKMGNTGYSYGAHLHFQVEFPKGTPVNPEPYLKGEKIINGGDKYEVVIGEFDTKGEAVDYAVALQTLGTDCTVRKKE